MSDNRNTAASAPAESVTADLTALKEELATLAPMALGAPYAPNWTGAQTARIAKLKRAPGFAELWPIAINKAREDIAAAKAEQQE